MQCLYSQKKGKLFQNTNYFQAWYYIHPVSKVSNGNSDYVNVHPTAAQHKNVWGKASGHIENYAKGGVVNGGAIEMSWLLVEVPCHPCMQEKVTGAPVPLKAVYCKSAGMLEKWLAVVPGVRICASALKPVITHLPHRTNSPYSL